MGGSYARTLLPPALSSTTYNDSNRLTQRGAATLTYDDNGNLTSDGVNTYTWNARNQLAAISGTVSATFQYDAFGRRVSKTVSGSTTSYLYDGADAVQEQGGGSPLANMLVGGVDEVFTRTDGVGTSSSLSDGLGSMLALTDSAGAVQTQYTYEPFGKTASSGATSSNTSQYTGRENDGTGLYYYRARYYSPSLQRFISEDPIGFAGGDVNLYGYVSNNPISFTDPSGKIAPLIVAMGVGAAAGGIFNAAGSIIFQKMSGRACIDWHQVGNAAVAGMVGGALAAIGGGGIAAMSVSGLESAVGNAALGGAVGGASGLMGQTTADIIAPPGRFLSPREKEARAMSSCVWGTIGGGAGALVPSGTSLGYAAGTGLSNAVGAGSQSPVNPGPNRYFPVY